MTSAPAHRIAPPHVVAVFSPDMPPAIEIAPGDALQVITLDASGGRLLPTVDVQAYETEQRTGRHRSNPATGPIAVRGARPGQELVVHVREIRVDPEGYLRTKGRGGVLEEGIERPLARRAVVEGASVQLEGSHGVHGAAGALLLPLRPMIGVIGTAPASGEYPTMAPGPHGGNMDLNVVRPGSCVHLPVFVDGGLLAVGDVHATMGDGEVSGGGVEIGATMTLQVELAESPTWPLIWIEGGTAVSVYGYGASTDDAVRAAVDNATRFLQQRLGLSRTDAYLAVSAAGDVRLGQAARLDIDATAHVELPAALFPAGGSGR